MAEDQSSCPLVGSSPSPCTPALEGPETTPPSNPSDPSPLEECSQPSSLPEVSGPSQKRSRQLKSEVWNHFERFTDPIDGLMKAKCLHCGQKLAAKSKNGTSHLKDHINTRCSRKHLKVDLRQMCLNYNANRSEGSRLENYNFDQDISRKELSVMVCMHEYPLSIVDHIGFRRFISSLNPNFKLISRNTLKSDILKLFESSKSRLKKIFEDHSGKIAITTDMWIASHQKKGYMAVTAHFIDEQWNLHEKIIRFAYVPCPHTKGILAQVLINTFSKYNIAEKISVVVVDNCTTNDAMMEILKHRFDSGSLLLGGEFLHMRCSAHILNLIVQDGLSVISKSIEKIRNCVLFWTGTPKRIEQFEDKARSCKLDCSKKLVLDCKTRWNSTFLMLQSAIPFKDVFSKLKTNNPHFKFVLPSHEEWKFAIDVCQKLEVFYKVTLLFSGRNYPTANVFFKQVCEIKLALIDWLSSDVDVIRVMADSMDEKFEKYWSNISGILAVAAVLDPRDKLECVSFYFNMIYGELAHIELERVKSLLYDLLAEYDEFDSPNCENYARDGVTFGKKNSNSQMSGSSLWDQVKETKQGRKKSSVKAELDLYLDDDVQPNSSLFDVLHYWKLTLKFPTLRNIARDILAIPASTVASESAFSSGGRLVSPQRSKLASETVETLMCLQNWSLQEYAGLDQNFQAYAPCTDDDFEPESVKFDDILEYVGEDVLNM